MDTLDGSEWDVVIISTGIAESLLALSLSRSGKRILHLDPNEHYGGDEAALSLSEAEEWAERHSREEAPSSFSHATVQKAGATEDSQQPKLASSRAYSIALAPHLIYSRSNFISTAVSARIHNQLEFQAVGSWFVLNASFGEPSLTKVPGGREDVFADKSLDLKSTRALMKFLRFVADYEEKPQVWQVEKDTPFPSFLQSKFGLPQASLAPILALTMSEMPPLETSTELALSRIARHARSIGAFGPGFGAVLPKWGGLAEIAQVACRACAVGGGVYVLGKETKNVSHGGGDLPINLVLGDGEKVTAKWLASSKSILKPEHSRQADNSNDIRISKSISVVSSPLSTLFPSTSEGGVTPAGAVVVIPAQSDDEPAVHVFAHTSEAGECPTGQCILYASVALPHEQGFPRLEQGVTALLKYSGDGPIPTVLWRMQYEQTFPAHSETHSENGVVTLPPLSSSLAFEDDVLNSVKTAWQEITSEDEQGFMKFEAREGAVDDNDD